MINYIKSCILEALAIRSPYTYAECEAAYERLGSYDELLIVVRLATAYTVSLMHAIEIVKQKRHKSFYRRRRAMSGKRVLVTRTTNPKENLCDTCKFKFENCKPTEGVLEFGTGVGNDNVTACNAYRERVERVECSHPH